MALLKNASAFPEGAPLTIQYMFYDTVDGRPDVLNDAQYNPQMAECCMDPIIDA